MIRHTEILAPLAEPVSLGKAAREVNVARWLESHDVAPADNVIRPGHDRAWGRKFHWQPVRLW